MLSHSYFEVLTPSVTYLERGPEVREVVPFMVPMSLSVGFKCFQGDSVKNNFH